MKADNRARINGLFNEMEVLKNNRKRDMDLIKTKEEEILKALKVGQEVIVYKNNDPHVLTINIKRSIKFDRTTLAEDIGVPQTRLNIPGVAELTEKGTITSSTLDNYWNEEEEEKLKIKKATKKDVERLMQSNVFTEFYE